VPLAERLHRTWDYACLNQAEQRGRWPTQGFLFIDVADVTGFPEMMDGRVERLPWRCMGVCWRYRNNPEREAAMLRVGLHRSICLVVDTLSVRSHDLRARMILKQRLKISISADLRLFRGAAKNP